MSPEVSHKNGQGAEAPLLGGEPESWGCSVWRREVLREDLTVTFQKYEQRFTAKACSDRTGSKGFNCKYVTEYFFTEKFLVT